jgi:hypothetical protein
MGDKLLLNGAAGADRWLWGLNAPFRSCAPEQRARAARRGREEAQKADLIGAEWAVIPAREGPSISPDKVLRRSVDDNAWDEESDEVWRGMDRSNRYGRALWPRETESLPERHAVRVHAQDAAGRPAPVGCCMLRQLSKAVRDDI